MPPGGGREDLNNEVRRSLTADIVQFLGVTDDRDVRLNHRVHIIWRIAIFLKQADSKGPGIDLAFFIPQIMNEKPDDVS